VTDVDFARFRGGIGDSAAHGAIQRWIFEIQGAPRDSIAESRGSRRTARFQREILRFAVRFALFREDPGASWKVLRLPGRSAGFREDARASETIAGLPG